MRWMPKENIEIVIYMDLDIIVGKDLDEEFLVLFWRLILKWVCLSIQERALKIFMVE
eukprot:UN21528